MENRSTGDTWNVRFAHLGEAALSGSTQVRPGRIVPFRARGECTAMTPTATSSRLRKLGDLPGGAKAGVRRLLRRAAREALMGYGLVWSRHYPPQPARPAAMGTRR